MNRIEKAIDNLLVGTCGEIKSRIEQISFEIEIEGTKSKGYCYGLKVDANGNMRLKDLVEFIDTKLVDYAIPKKEIDEASKYLRDTGSTSKIVKLKKKANSLFTDLQKTGEGGEILLYILVLEYLKLPQLISKMALKTSGKLHYQGADGVHVKYDNQTDRLNLYWGESKMYKSMSKAMDDCLDSVKGYLLDSQSAKSVQERDLELITSNINANVNDEKLENALARYFDKDDLLSNDIEYKAVCFIGFDRKVYASKGVIKSTEEIRTTINEKVSDWYKTLGEKIKGRKKLPLKEMHIFLMPFPSVEDFRRYFLSEIK
jgi:HamA